MNRPEVYFARIERKARVGNSNLFLLDAITEGDVLLLSENSPTEGGPAGERFVDLLARRQAVALVVSADDGSEIQSILSACGEGGWVCLGGDGPGGSFWEFPMGPDIANWAELAKRDRSSFNKVDEAQAKKLDRLFSVDNFARSEITVDPKRLPGELSGTEQAEFLVVLDVGQANCVAICARDGVPIAYFDFGWPLPASFFSQVSASYGQPFQPDPPCLCTHAKSRPPVILSHWHWDHWAGAYIRPELLDSNWYVPMASNSLGPTSAGHAAMLLLTNKLFLVPDLGLSPMGLGFGFMAQGVGSRGKLKPRSSDIDNCGLVLLAKVGTSEGPLQVLLPGDCRYNKIPAGFLPNPLDGLLVTHHGGSLGNTKSGCIPNGRGTHSAAVSVGPNPYQHPNWTCMADHTGRGWGCPVPTMAFGNLSYGVLPEAIAGCGLPNCILKTRPI